MNRDSTQTDTTDPVCGMPVTVGNALFADYLGRRFLFCSAFCRDTFLVSPQSYVAPAITPEKAIVHRRIAYFSMEVAIDVEMPTYSGGLGVLAGDTLQSDADLGFPVIAV